jgi:hypothetical protein
VTAMVDDDDDNECMLWAMTTTAVMARGGDVSGNVGFIMMS